MRRGTTRAGLKHRAVRRDLGQYRGPIRLAVVGIAAVGYLAQDHPTGGTALAFVLVTAVVLLVLEVLAPTRGAGGRPEQTAPVAPEGRRPSGRSGLGRLVLLAESRPTSEQSRTAVTIEMTSAARTVAKKPPTSSESVRPAVMASRTRVDDQGEQTERHQREGQRDQSQQRSRSGR